MQDEWCHFLQILPGIPFPYGVQFNSNSVNFAIYIKEAKLVTLCLFSTDQENRILKEIELLFSVNQTGEVWHVEIKGLPPYFIYAYRVTLREEQTSYLLLDPYAKGVTVKELNSWSAQRTSFYQPLGQASFPSLFDWQGDKPPLLPLKDLILYEMHVRGFTKDSSSKTTFPGTYRALTEKISYLKELGINAVELMPIYEFNENETSQLNPHTKEKLCNYFGYSTVNFFSPMSRYASQTRLDSLIDEFKKMIREFHKNEIEVILDVAYNHTFEGNHLGPTLSFKGLDRKAYYMIEGANNYLNFSGCGNTFNTNHPVTLEFIIDSLRYWVTEMHIDGFRFDLASIFNRAENGTLLNKAPLVEAISLDPVLKNIKLIAEAWDAEGLYQVGRFYPGKRWSEWNGRYRDVIRRFIKGTANYKSSFATALCGSPDLYQEGRSPLCSINFITAHDGFSLADLVSYSQKHNEENGEDNRDGFNHNDSWNCGYEGHSSNKKIVSLRERQIRNFHLALMISQGVPMLLMGDEYAHTRNGNNNTWCQDNSLNWFLWDHLENRLGFFRFYRGLIHFRQQEPLLKQENFLKDQAVIWHGLKPFNVEWEKDDRFLAFSLNRKEDQQPHLYAAFNAAHRAYFLIIPSAGEGKTWHWVVNTHNASPHDFFEKNQRPKLEASTFCIHSYSALLLIALPN